MYRPSPSDVVNHDVKQTCSYSRWASREILCDRNYMEVSRPTMVVSRLSVSTKQMILMFLFRCQATWLCLMLTLRVSTRRMLKMIQCST